jgi:hypothetical protein
MSDQSYPVSESFKVLRGYDIYRSPKLIVAIVVVQSQFGKDIRLYRWQKRTSKTGESTWKVDLARMSVARWDWNKVAQKVIQLKQEFEIGGGEP